MNAGLSRYPEIAAVLDGRERWCVVQADCRDVLAEMPDKSVDLVLTDPPYGHNNNDGDLIAHWEKALGHKKAAKAAEARPIANDGPEANDLMRWCLPHWHRLLRPGCCCCCCGGGGGPDPQFARWSLWLDEVFCYKQMVIWDKGPIGMGWHYRRSYECVLVAEKQGGPAKWYDETKKIENIIRPGDYGIRKIIPTADEHPTPKPSELAAHFIALHTEPGDLVLDNFAGRGWVGEAAVRMGRRYVGVEIDPHWAKRARERVANAAAQGGLFVKTTAKADNADPQMSIGGHSET